MAAMKLPLLTQRGATLRYDRDQGIVFVLDRRLYPHETQFVACPDLEAVAMAITTMIVQGGPPLAYVAGYGLALVARQKRQATVAQQREALTQAAAKLRLTRPTADDLANLLAAAETLFETALRNGEDLEQTLVTFVDAQVAEGDRVAEACGRNAATLLPDGANILTHCFAGAALNWMLYTAFVEQKKQIQLYPNETRPYLQGARLTAHQAHEIGVKVTLLTDNMAGFCFSRGMFTHYITAADRIALDGSIANKVGTYQYAVLAARHNVPFYVLGYDGPDFKTLTGADIPIEERDPEEVLSLAGKRIAPQGIDAYYPAFDVTPPELISKIITEKGIFLPSAMATYDKTGSLPVSQQKL